MTERKTPKQQMDILLQKKGKLDARIQKKKAIIRRQWRKDQTRKKIILGGIVQKYCEHDPDFKAHFDKLIKAEVTEETAKKLFDL